MTGPQTFFGSTIQKPMFGRRGGEGRQEEREDDSKVVWPEVTGLCVAVATVHAVQVC